MTFIADLHVHSHFSRATAKNLDLEHLYMAAQRKGITVVGTGDATHPDWFAAIQSKLRPAEDGLFRLRDDLAMACNREITDACRAAVRFILVSEISNIYKKDGCTRKNHNLVFLPSIDAAERFNRKLAKIGNIQSDGRPILGLDARNLLEIVLETDENAFLVPAHIWTPWFSLLGSKSGFDSLEACFEDLSEHVFAVETGLSSDPPMNRRVSSLDRLSLISNSDAHSPVKLGREANIFHTSLSYAAMHAALKSNHPDQFGGTLEFYPEEGKYHLDGHRKCGLRFTPEETQALGGICPGCHRALTLGVLYRVETLADRRIDEIPGGFPPFESLIPLHEILSEVMQVGPATKKVGRAYEQLLAVHGSELDILRGRDPHDLDLTGPPLIGEAIRRMRTGEVHLAPGYDGEFGTIQIFTERERRELIGQRQLFAAAAPDSKANASPSPTGPKKLTPFSSRHAESPQDHTLAPLTTQTNPGQQQAIAHGSGPLMIVAGPGTGKTTTLTRRIAHLVIEHHRPADQILAITFTDKAAREMRARLEYLLAGRPLPLATTFHAFCGQLLQETAENDGVMIIGDDDRLFIIKGVLRRMAAEGIETTLKSREMGKRIEMAKQNLQLPDQFFESVAQELPASQFARGYRLYQDLLEQEGFVDYDDLILQVVLKLEKDEAFRQSLRNRYRYVFIDEYQDLNHAQYRLVKALVPPDGPICVIGDPDQAIYGFRGSDSIYFNRFV
ncbi:MAG: UvrD-helicase domain-containing protein, partial [Desulfobacterales bacterium]